MRKAGLLRESGGRKTGRRSAKTFCRLLWYSSTRDERFVPRVSGSEVVGWSGMSFEKSGRKVLEVEGEMCGVGFVWRMEVCVDYVKRKEDRNRSLLYRREGASGYSSSYFICRCGVSVCFLYLLEDGSGWVCRSCGHVRGRGSPRVLGGWNKIYRHLFGIQHEWVWEYKLEEESGKYIESTEENLESFLCGIDSRKDEEATGMLRKELLLL